MLVCHKCGCADVTIIINDELWECSKCHHVSVRVEDKRHLRMVEMLREEEKRVREDERSKIAAAHN